jgi:amidase
MTIQQMQMQLISKEKSSYDLTLEVLKRIKEKESFNAIAVVSPVSLNLAKQRDEERRRGYLRGPLHGIPIVIKDNILYADGTPTTANSFALSTLIPKENAFLVNQLLEAGAVVVGKANLSEFAYFMGGPSMPSGYGSMYGQVKHPVYPSLDPLGSSTGSAVAVALGLIPASIGSETNGSLMAPGFMNQVVSFKPSFGLVSKHGIIPISPTQDTAGPIATSVYDCALLFDVLNVEDKQDETTLRLPRQTDLARSLLEPIKPGNIGFFYIKNQEYSRLELLTIKTAKTHLTNLGFVCIDIQVNSMVLDNYPTLLQEFKVSLNAFLSEFSDKRTPKSLEEVIEFNKTHQERCLRYGQDILIASEATLEGLSHPLYVQQRKSLLEESATMQHLMIEHDLQAIVTPTWLSYAPIFGNPSLCIPEGYVEEKPTALIFVGKKYDDRLLLKIGHLYEQSRKGLGFVSK